MKLFAWTGPEAEAQRYLTEAGDTSIILLKSEEECLILQEGETASIDANSYEILDRTGELRGDSFTVLNNIPVTEEGRDLFEQRFMNRARLIEEEPGFVAIRVLRPLESDTYIILTQWEDETSFKAWQESQAYSKAHAKRGTDQGIDKRPNIFPRPSFVTTYR